VLRVVIDLGNASDRTGTGMVALGLLDALERYVPEEIEASEAGISSIGNTLRPIRRLFYLQRLARLVKTGFNGANVAHFINSYVPRKHPNVAYVSSIHDLDAIQCPEVYSRRFVLYIRKAYQTACERAEVIVTHTEAVGAMIRDEYDLPETRVRVTGIGLHRRFVAAVDAASGSLRNPPRRPIPTLLYVGQVSKKKNTAWLVRSVVRGVKSGALPNMMLMLAGNAGHGAEEVRRELKEAGDLVVWHYSPSLEELVRLYLESSAVVLPSRREGFGIPLLEAMYCGKPIVASRIPTSVEVAASAANFFTLDNADEFYDALHGAVEDCRAEQRRLTAEQQLSKYSWQRLAPMYLDVYRDAFQQVHPSAR
jgi:glycosyltransferase involved in cell wall biosynthesis